MRPLLAHSGPRRFNVQADFKEEENEIPCDGTNPARSFNKSWLCTSIFITAVEIAHKPAITAMDNPSFRHDVAQASGTTIDSDVKEIVWPRSFLWEPGHKGLFLFFLA